jgi:hypothetical protein
MTVLNIQPPKHLANYAMCSPEWWEANDQAARLAMSQAFVWYGGEGVDNYHPPLWKTCEQHRWIDALLEDVRQFEERMDRDDGGDVCIR